MSKHDIPANRHIQGSDGQSCGRPVPRYVRRERLRFRLAVAHGSARRRISAAKSESPSSIIHSDEGDIFPPHARRTSPPNVTMLGSRFRGTSELDRRAWRDRRAPCLHETRHANLAFLHGFRLSGGLHVTL
jgi:hypothetical protein